MVDLNEFCGDTPLRASLVKKRAKEMERLDRLMSKAIPIQAEIAMYDEMIAAIDKRNRAVPATDYADDDREETGEPEAAAEESTAPGGRKNPYKPQKDVILAVEDHGDGTATLSIEESQKPAFLRNTK